MFLFSVAPNAHCECRVACLAEMYSTYQGCPLDAEMLDWSRHLNVIWWSAQHRRVDAARSQHHRIFEGGGFVISFIKALSASKRRQNPSGLWRINTVFVQFPVMKKSCCCWKAARIFSFHFLVYIIFFFLLRNNSITIQEWEREEWKRSRSAWQQFWGEQELQGVLASAGNGCSVTLCYLFCWLGMWNTC